MDNMVLKSYKEILKEFEADDSSKHLLLCNGFNCSLGVYTRYKDIFEKMKVNYSGYKHLNIDENNLDIEHIIGVLKEQINPLSDNKKFLDDYINNKVKFDFMTSVYSIVKENIKKIYQEQSGEIGLLFQNFTNFFTLNYDPLLYLLLMKYKMNDRLIAFNNTQHYKMFDVELRYPVEYNEAKKIRDTFTKSLEDSQRKVVNKVSLSKVKKTELVAEIERVFNSKGMIFKKEFVDVLYEENKLIRFEANDGFQGELFSNAELNFKQNVFFLHGAFHIYKNGKSIKKITQSKDKALYTRLEEILNNPTEEIICIFTNENKEEEIKGNQYLCHCLNKLEELEGSVVILGSSFDKNDEHIFNRINNSKVDKIYNDLYYNENEQKEIMYKKKYERIKELFPNKEIVLFDSKTIFYKNTEVANDE